MKKRDEKRQGKSRYTEFSDFGVGIILLATRGSEFTRSSTVFLLCGFQLFRHFLQEPIISPQFGPAQAMSERKYKSGVS